MISTSEWLASTGLLVEIHNIHLKNNYKYELKFKRYKSSSLVGKIDSRSFKPRNFKNFGIKISLKFLKFVENKFLLVILTQEIGTF